MLVVSAAEASGDRLGAALVRELGLPARGLAGPEMRAAGVEAVARAEDLGVMGLAEVVAVLPRAVGIHKAMVGALDGARLLVVIDAPDFNIPLARAARKRGVPVLFYVSPQVWAWRRGRAETIAELAQQVICLLPFEPAFYPEGKAIFVGNPVAERCEPLGPPAGESVCLAPGSRQQEVDRLLQTFLAASEGQARTLARAPSVSLPELPSELEIFPSLVEAASPARVCLVASGTATLELACMQRPMVVCYRLNALTWTLAKALVDLPFVSLPNLVLGRRVVPEFLQDLDPAEIRSALERASEGQDLAEVRAALRPEGAQARVTALVRSYL